MISTPPMSFLDTAGAHILLFWSRLKNKCPWKLLGVPVLCLAVKIWWACPARSNSFHWISSSRNRQRAPKESYCVWLKYQLTHLRQSWSGWLNICITSYPPIHIGPLISMCILDITSLELSYIIPSQIRSLKPSLYLHCKIIVIKPLRQIHSLFLSQNRGRKQRTLVRVNGIFNMILILKKAAWDICTVCSVDHTVLSVANK